MPLPDERPRQSVANLIGRFENQVKRQPSSSPGSARSLSVVSNTTEDSAKEEVKERREWPPKSVSPDVRPPVIIPSSSFSRNLALAQASSDATLATSATHADVVEDPVLTPRPNSTTSIPDKPKPVITPPQRQLSIGITAPTPTTSETPTTAKPPTKTPTKPSASKPLSSAATRTPARTSARPSTAQPIVAQPIKPQHTGPASTSAFARKPIPKAPATPASAKTPARASLTPSRPKTPSSARAKTPSTGLFAPTAASLAKARNAQPPPPTPIKKVTLSSTAAERLSKPTAASLSRARTPTSTTPTARGVTKPSAPTTPRAAATKPRVSAATASSKKPAPLAATKVVAGTGVAVATAAATEATLAANETVFEEHGHDENHIDEHLNGNHVEEQSDGIVHTEDPQAEEENDSHENTVEASDVSVVEAEHEADLPTSATEPDTGLDVPVEVHASSAIDERVDEVKSRAHAGNDIEDIVNLLETVPRARTESITSIPDEVSEIPDEE